MHPLAVLLWAGCGGADCASYGASCRSVEPEFWANLDVGLQPEGEWLVQVTSNAYTHGVGFGEVHLVQGGVVVDDTLRELMLPDSYAGACYDQERVTDLLVAPEDPTLLVDVDMTCGGHAAVVRFVVTLDEQRPTRPALVAAVVESSVQ